MKIINILPRQSGKTNKIIDLFSEDTSDTVIIVKDERHKHDLRRMIQRNNNITSTNVLNEKIKTPRQTDGYFNNKILSRILIDELLFFDSNDIIRFRNNLQNLAGAPDIIAFTTAKEQLPMDAINLITIHKANGGELDDNLYDDLPEYEIDLIKRLYHSFITDLDCTIVIGPGTIRYADISIKPELESYNLPFN
jgi:hypothetical protein